MIERSKWSPSRRDPRALAFGIAFLLLGSAGLLRNTGLELDGNALAQLALISLGLAGLVGLLVPRRRA